MEIELPRGSSRLLSRLERRKAKSNGGGGRGRTKPPIKRGRGSKARKARR